MELEFECKNLTPEAQETMFRIADRMGWAHEGTMVYAPMEDADMLEFMTWDL